MEVSGFVISFLSVVLGIFATVLVSRYYFKRSVDKSLIPYLDFSTQLLSGIDPEVKKDLSISYQGVEVKDLYQVQYLIANTGEKPIRDVIKPLELIIPEDQGAILDSSLIHVYPEGREVKLEISDDKKTVKFLFPLLNKGDFFIVKLLVKGSLSKEKIKFNITSEDLPPCLNVQRLPREKVAIEDDTDSESRVDKAALITGLVCLFLAIPPIYLTYQTDLIWFNSPHDSPLDFITNITLDHFIKITAWFSGLLMGLIGIAGIMVSCETVEFRKKNKFLIPNGLTSSKFYKSRNQQQVMEMLEELEEHEAETVYQATNKSDSQ